MKLYLARHGDYAIDTMAGQDRLTEKGEADIERVAAFVKGLNQSVSHIFHSSKNRAQQTAALLAQGFHSAEAPQLRAGLNPEDELGALVAELAHEENDVLIVGHLPFLTKLTSQLLTGGEFKDIVAFTTGTLVCLEQIDRSHWTIAWVIRPDLLMP